LFIKETAQCISATLKSIKQCTVKLKTKDNLLSSIIISSFE